MKINHNWWVPALCFLCISNINCSYVGDGSSDPKVDGYVPNEETAIKIAEAVWIPIYGKSVLNERPYTAILDSGIWTVEGTLHATHGGVANMEIRKSDAKIIAVWHGK